MIEFDFASLSSLGLTPALASRAASFPAPEGATWQLMCVTEVHRESVRVHDGITEMDARDPAATRALAIGTKARRCRR